MKTKIKYTEEKKLDELLEKKFQRFEDSYDLKLNATLSMLHRLTKAIEELKKENALLRGINNELIQNGQERLRLCVVDLEETFGIVEGATRINVSEAILRQAVKEGLITSRKTTPKGGGKYLFLLKDLLEYRDKHLTNYAKT